VRAGALRVVRTVVVTGDDLSVMIRLNVHYLAARCFDIDLDNKIERLHALRLMRKCLFLAPLRFPAALTRSLVSAAEASVRQEQDKMAKTSLALLCELSEFGHCLASASCLLTL